MPEAYDPPSWSGIILSAAGAAGAGVWFVVPHGFGRWSFQSKGVFIATVLVEGTLDPVADQSAGGGSPFTLVTLTTSLTLGSFTGPLFAVRANVTLFTSGAVTVTAMGTE